MKKILLILLVFTLSFNAYSQLDNEFWFSTPTVAYEGWHNWESLIFCFVTVDEPAEITLYQPANVDNPWLLFPPVVIKMDAHSFEKVDLTDRQGVMRLKSSEVTGTSKPMPFGVHITSTANIYAYFSHYGDNYDIYSLKGKNALGTDFIVPSQYKYDTSDANAGSSSTHTIDVLATEDNTEITFNFKQRTTATATAVATLTVSMDRGYTYAVRALNKLGARHLHNTRITTNNKPIVVNTNDDSVKKSGMDLIGDQIVPIDMTGSRYVAVSAKRVESAVEEVYIFPIEDGVIVTDGTTTSPSLNVGDQHVFVLPYDAATFVRSTNGKKFIAFQVTGFKSSSTPTVESTELAGVMLPKLDCTGSTEIAFSTNIPAGETARPLFNLVTKKEFIGGFVVNDNPAVITAGNFQPVPGTGDEYYYYKYDANGTHDVVRIKNTLGYFQAGIRDAKGSSNGYGYFSDYRSIRLRPQLSQDYFVSGDTLVLSLSDASALENIVWEAPNGSVHYGSPVSIYPIDESYSGEYKVTATTKDACGEVPAAYLTINIYKTHEEYGLCHGEDLTLTAPGHAPYIWAHDSSLSDTTSTIIVSPDDTTHYVVKNNRSGGNILINGNFQKLTHNNAVRSDYTNGGTSPSAVATPGRYAITNNASLVSPDYSKVYDCSDYPNSGRHMVVNTTGEAGKRIWVDTIDVKQNTSYTLSANFITAKENGIPAQIYFSVNGVSLSDVITPPNAKPTGSPANIAYGTKKEHWQHYTSNVWQSGLHTKAVVSITTDQFNSEGASLCIDNISFAPEYQVSDTLTVNVEDSPTPKIIGDDIICHGQAILSVEAPLNNSSYTHYNWYLLPDGDNPISTDPQLIVTQGGSYMVEVFTANGCSGIDAKTLPPIVEIDATLQPQVEVCDDAPHYALSYKISSMELVHYDITYDAQAQAAGFVNQTDIPITSKDEITITMPSGIAPGIYNAQVQLVSNSTCGDSKTLPVEITVRIGAHKLIAQKWNEVLSIYNADNNPGGYNYQSQQWYKNGEILYGETGTNLYIPGGLNPNDSYSVLLTLEDGRVIMTCGFIPESREDNNSLPTIASISQEITIKLDEWLYNNGTVQAVFTTVSGVVYSRQELSTAYSTLRYPDRVGLYILEITSSMGKGVYKVFVK